ILEASARILESEGPRGFNTNAIAAKAGVSVGSLYQYFPNKDAIVLALIGSYEEGLHSAVSEAVQAVSSKEMENPPFVRRRARPLVRALVTVHFRRPRINRVLEAEEERLGSGADDAEFHAMVLQLLQDHKNEMAVPVSAAAERVVIAILRAVVDLGLASGASP